MTHAGQSPPRPGGIDLAMDGLPGVLHSRTRLQLHRPDLKPAAVLVLLLRHEGEWQMLFTVRTRQVKHHKGQVSFPGGAYHSDDVDLAATALRETWEEIGVAPAAVRVVGALDDLATISDYQVTPFVGLLQAAPEMVPSPAETDEIFWVPLAPMLDARLWEISERRFNGRLYYPVWHFLGARHRIWGITGHILAHFLEVAFGWHHPHLDPLRIPSDVTP